MKKELNKELNLSEANIAELIEELSSREELACKGDATGINICLIN